MEGSEIIAFGAGVFLGTLLGNVIRRFLEKQRSKKYGKKGQ